MMILESIGRMFTTREFHPVVFRGRETAKLTYSFCSRYSELPFRHWRKHMNKFNMSKYSCNAASMDSSTLYCMERREVS